jgi:outer membrane protein assembly factor BamB
MMLSRWSWSWLLLGFSLSVLCVLCGESRTAEPWTTYRGNPQRTGNTDGKPGPQAGKVLWSFASKEHFIAAPLPVGDQLFVSGLGAFNVSTFYSLSVDPAAKERVNWSKSTPYLKLPTVSSPAVSGDTLIFGDGMHQTDGAILHCLKLDKGLPLWQFPVPGTLVHLEGSPTVVDGKVFLGGGAAGVLCLDSSRVTLDNKEMTLPDIQKVLEKKWAELQAKYQEDLKKDPCFAVKPTEDQLPKPAPIKVWQKGQEKWHVDAPVAVVDGKVLVASAFLDKEMVGSRAVYCLDAKNGNEMWKAPLTLNPWGGPTVAGDAIVIGCSSIAFDMKALKGAKGEVVCLDLAKGDMRWKKEIPGGVLGCVAVSDGLAIATASDGKVRAYDLTSGEQRWRFEGKAPFFAPAAVVGGLAYVADTAGVVTAIDLKTGAAKWTLDLGAGDVKTPGMVYGGPAVQGGRLYVATCNIEGPFLNKPTTVVCIGDK